MEPTGFDHHGPDRSGPSSRVALPSARMSTEEVLKVLGRSNTGSLILNQRAIKNGPGIKACVIRPREKPSMLILFFN
jgi:hypothetical protein